MTAPLEVSAPGPASVGLLRRATDLILGALGLLLVLRVVFPSQLPPLTQMWLVLPARSGVPLDWYSPFQYLGALAPFALLLLLYGVRRRQLGAELPVGWSAVLSAILLPVWNVIAIPRLLALLSEPTSPAPAVRRLWLTAQAAAILDLLATAAWLAVPGGALTTPPGAWKAAFWSVPSLAALFSCGTLWLLHQAFQRERLAPHSQPGDPQPTAPHPDGLATQALLGASCMDCFSQPLFPLSAVRGAASCPACAGTLVGPVVAPVLRERIGLNDQAFELLVRGAEGRPAPCAECGAEVRTATLRGVPVRACAQCRACWIRRGGLFELTQGAFGLQPPNPWSASASASPPPPTLGVRPLPWALALLTVALLGSAWVRDSSPDCPASSGRVRRADPLGVAFGCETRQQERVGPLIVRTPMGQLLSETHYQQGLKSGPHRRLDGEGKVAETGQYQQDLKDGRWEYFQGGTLVRTESYRQGALHGSVVTLHPNGAIATRTQYEDGLKHGQYVSYREDKSLLEQGSFERGLRSSRWTQHDATGAVIAVGEEGSAPVALGAALVSDPVYERGIDDPVPLRGGRTLAWWRDRLRTLNIAARADETHRPLLESTLARARASGLTLQEGASGPEVTLAAPPATAARASP